MDSRLKWTLDRIVYFGSDRVFWIDYFGSIILDRVFWIDYFGSIILDRLRIVARRGRAIAEPIARWALKIDSAIAVQRWELNTCAYAYDTYTFCHTQLRNHCAARVQLHVGLLGEVYRCRENTLIACIFIDFSPSTTQHHTQRDHALCL